MGDKGSQGNLRRQRPEEGVGAVNAWPSLEHFRKSMEVREV
jgi:hypothetical protein